MTQPKVSVCIVTYNHEKYIEQALLSALNQRTDFGFEIIVGDDGSTDATPAIIRQVATQYPELRVIMHSSNVGVTDNYLSVHGAARGEYVAHLDGDDYWLADKLQTQVAVMEANPALAVSWHPLIAFDERGMHYIVGDHRRLLRELLGREQVDLGDAILAYGVTGFHSSCMYRRSARTLFAYSHPFLIDYRLSLSLLEWGSGCHLRRPLGCYRAFHDQSATRGGRDFVGPGLMRTLREYSISHPRLRPRIAAHCLSACVSRTRFQGRLLGLLLSRTLGATRVRGDSERRIFHGNISLAGHVLSQWRYAINSLRLLWLGVCQRALPSFRNVMLGIRVDDYLSRKKEKKTAFFDRRYGSPFSERTSRCVSGNPAVAEATAGRAKCPESDPRRNMSRR